MRSLDEFEKKIGYKFKNRNLLITALTHSSYANESRGGDQSYERLEFLGDSILGFVTAEYLCKAFPDIPEGKLTKKRAALVCEKSLCGFTRSFGAGELLRLSHGEQHSGGRERPSILADVFESITAAIYLDSGSLEEAKRFVVDAAYDPVYGARPLRRYVQHTVETMLSKRLLRGDVTPGQTVTVDAENGELVMK